MPESQLLRIDEIFTSKTNTRIANNLISELLKLLAPRFKPTQKQMWDWLGALHRHQRGRFLKEKSGKLSADNRRIHINSRINEVGFYWFLLILLKILFFIEILLFF
jgi:hypothetical protein